MMNKHELYNRLLLAWEDLDRLHREAMEEGPIDDVPQGSMDLLGKATDTTYRTLLSLKMGIPGHARTSPNQTVRPRRENGFDYGRERYVLAQYGNVELWFRLGYSAVDGMGQKTYYRASLSIATDTYKHPRALGEGRLDFILRQPKVRKQIREAFGPILSLIDRHGTVIVTPPIAPLP